MFAKVHKAVNTPACDNKGSCMLLAEYLEKENAGKEMAERMPFFSHEYDEVSKGTVIQRIDSNTRNLGKNDPKFFMVSINPSHRELQHLIKITTGRKGVEDFNQLTNLERQKVFTALREYSRGVMDIYARNFNRPNVQSGADLVYFAKIETMRRWHPWDREVRDGQAVKGQQKPGLNLHVHVIVSRNDRTQSTKLSPQSRSRGGKQQLKGKAVEQGFNHEVFKQKAGELFRQRYNYQGVDKEAYQRRAGKQGNPGAALPTAGQLAGGVGNKISGKIIAKAKQGITQGHFTTEKKTLATAAKVAMIVANPKAAIARMLKEKVLSILQGGAGKEL